MSQTEAEKAAEKAAHDRAVAGKREDAVEKAALDKALADKTAADKEADNVRKVAEKAAADHKALSDKTLDLKKAKKQSDIVLEQIQQCLKDNGGNEIGMPINSKYWDLQNNYRQLIREGK